MPLLSMYYIDSGLTQIAPEHADPDHVRAVVLDPVRQPQIAAVHIPGAPLLHNRQVALVNRAAGPLRPTEAELARLRPVARAHRPSRENPEAALEAPPNHRHQ